MPNGEIYPLATIILTAIFRDRQKKSNTFLAEPETRRLRLCGILLKLHESTVNIYFGKSQKKLYISHSVSVDLFSTSPRLAMATLNTLSLFAVLRLACEIRRCLWRASHHEQHDSHSCAGNDHVNVWFLDLFQIVYIRLNFLMAVLFSFLFSHLYPIAPPFTYARITHHPLDLHTSTTSTGISV